jgi:amino acid adenylation domain-containing protein
MRLTLPQQDIYFEQLLYPNDPIYNIGAKIEIRGIIDVEIFRKAHKELINQHDTYRSLIVKNDDNVSIKILENHKSELGFIDFSGSSTSVEKANRYMQEEFLKPFDLTSGDLLHIFTLVKVQEDFYYLFSVYHHIITDGWGTSLMFQRLVQNYNEIYDNGSVTSLYPFTYKDFAEDDLAYRNSQDFEKDLEYWSNKFRQLPENLFDKKNEKGQINKSSRKELIIKREIYNQLIELASSQKCSTFHLILGLLYVYFGRKQQNNDFAIGLPVLNRNKSIYKKTVGLFMGVSPLRIFLNYEETFLDLIVNIKNQLRQDYRNQRLPLGKLIQELQLFSQKERLFNITLSYEKQDYAHHFKNTKTKVIPLSHQSEIVALALYIREFDELEDVKIDFDYNLNYFDQTDIEQIVKHFEGLLEEILINSDKKLNELNFLSKEEKQQLLFEFNNTVFNYSKENTFLDFFKEQVQFNSQKIALKDDFEDFTYDELDKKSNLVASYILDKFNSDKKLPIAVLMNRSANLVIVLLGILKTGRAYIPLDPSFPKDRLNYIVANSKTNAIICEKDNQIIEDSSVIDKIFIDSILNHPNDENTINEPVAAHETAYIIYTSGSTGNPKGVEIGHQSLLNFLLSIQDKPGFLSNDILFSVTTYSFDISILEFFVPLISGGTLYIADQNILSDPSTVIKKIEEIKPTIIQATPSFYQMLFNANWKGNKKLKVLCGGDLLSESLAEKLIHNCFELWNMYGPTETTIWSSCKKIEYPSEASNIGQPIYNTQFYILDEFFNLQPIGSQGAIYIAGDGLAKGYYKNEKLTAEKFIKNPFDSKSLFYETGDVGKWNSKGEIEFLGRNDNQVKVRGYRIELGDVESQLNQLDSVRDSVVIAKKGAQQEAFLVAYVLKNGAELNVEDVIKQLRTTLPHYMIPHAIIDLEEFPLTPNKKIDRKALSSRDVQLTTNQCQGKIPTSDIEIKLSQFWSEVLNTNVEIGVQDNFFALGGHSLNAVKLIRLIAKEFSFEITLKTIFDNPTIETLASYLQELNPVKIVKLPSAEKKDYYPLTPSQHAIWLASQHSVNSIAYNMSAGYRIEGTIDLEKINASVNQIIEKFEVLRTNFVEVNGIPYQKINAVENVKLQVKKYQFENGVSDEIVEDLVNSEFNLENDLLLRFYLLELSANKNLLLFSTHHIIMDGVSLEFFISEFIKNYEGSQEIIENEESRFQFKDYSEWLSSKLKLNQNRNEEFWKNYLNKYAPKDTFERDYDIKKNSQKGNTISFELTEELTSKLKEFSSSQNVTFYTFLAASINILIHKISDYTDICIGTVNSGRNLSELNEEIGMFVKTLVMRTKLNSDETIIDVLQKTKENINQINENSDVPFDKLPHNIFDMIFAFQNPEFNYEDTIELSDIKLAPYPIKNKYSRVPIVFNLFESKNQLRGKIDYNINLYNQSTIEMIISKFESILIEISVNPLLSLNKIDEKNEVMANSELDFDFNF